MNGVKRFDSVQALAQWIGCPALALEQTLEGLRLSKRGAPLGSGFEDERVFDRRLSLPLYAIEVTGALFHTQGGLEIDETCRVQTLAHQALPNLWAGGGAARGVSGPAVWGYLSGNGLLSALASAYIAARSIKQFLH